MTVQLLEILPYCRHIVLIYAWLGSYLLTLQGQSRINETRELSWCELFSRHNKVGIITALNFLFAGLGQHLPMPAVAIAPPVTYSTDNKGRYVFAMFLQMFLKILNTYRWQKTLFKMADEISRNIGALVMFVQKTAFVRRWPSRSTQVRFWDDITVVWSLFDWEVLRH